MHDGIAQMFRVIEHARMLVGTKAIATLSTGYLNALEYAKTRVQGPDLTQAADKTAPRVTITHHPDVRRSLMTQKSFTEGLRALLLYAATIQDRNAIARAHGTTDDAAERLNDLLLPIVKGYGSERSWVLLGTESLQTFGGSGFLADYPIEQYVRDAKIDTLYEGTTAIQARICSSARSSRIRVAPLVIFRHRSVNGLPPKAGMVSSKRNAACCSRLWTMSAQSWRTMINDLGASSGTPPEIRATSTRLA